MESDQDLKLRKCGECSIYGFQINKMGGKDKQANWFQTILYQLVPQWVSNIPNK